MIDLIGFMSQYGAIYCIGLLSLLALSAFCWRELKGCHGQYRNALARIKVIEESLRDKDNPARVYTRWELLDRINEIEKKLNMTTQSQEDMAREMQSITTGMLMEPDKKKK